MSSVISVTNGGIDVASIVSGLMTVERQPLDRLVTRQSAVKLQNDAVARLRTNFENLRTTASTLAASGLGRFSSSVSTAGIVLATLSAKPAAGSISFTVDQLAKAQGLRTASTVAGASSAITTADFLAVSTTTTAVGLGSAAVAGVAAGKYSLSVTQASAGATKTGATAVAPTVGAGTLTFEVGGSLRTITLPSTSSTGVAAAIQLQIDAQGGGATATLDTAGKLKLTSVREGSLATLQVTGGTALADLGLSVDASQISGTDGIVDVGGVTSTINSAGPGRTAVVTAGGGTLTFDTTGGLRLGTATVAVVSAGDKSLGAVAAAINGANVGASASAVKVSDGNWLLQMNSKVVGVNGSLSISAAAFSGVGGLLQTSTAQNAQITVGSGPGAYSITSNTNVFTDVMSGVTLTAVAEAATPVTVTVAQDDNASATAVERFVGSVNSMLSDIALQTKYDSVTKRPSPLTADAGIRSLATQLRSAISSIVGGMDNGLASNVGLDVQRDGTIKFDRAEFVAAMSADPSVVDRLFGRGGSSAGGVTFAGATDKTVAGTYDVVVTTAASKATATPAYVAGQRIGVRLGSVTATYDVPNGATDADVVAGLNAALTTAGLGIQAAVVGGGGVRLTATAFGSAGSFAVDLDVGGPATAWSTSAGSDAVGTINGRAATGIGNTLSLTELGTDAARGLSVTVDAGVTGTIPVTYSPGIAARVVNLASAATGEGGALTSSANGYQSRLDGFKTQIDRFEARLDAKEAQYRRQWSTVQTLLSSLQNQQSWLTSQISSLSGNG